MTRVICISSGKGGVGKTTLTANLGMALTELGYRTLVIDANLTTPNLGFHLGVPLYPKTLHDVLRGKALIEEATFIHPSGLKVIPAGISLDDLKNTRADQLNKVVLDLMGDHDIVFLDGAAGLGKEPLAGIGAADELLIVTNPDLPSVTDALKTVKVAEEMGTRVIGVILNKIKGHGSELSVEDVQSIIGYAVIAQVPFDLRVDDSLAAKTPIVQFSPNAKSSVEIKKLAASLVGLEWQPPAPKFSAWFSNLFSFLKK